LAAANTAAAAVASAPLASIITDAHRTKKAAHRLPQQLLASRHFANPLMKTVVEARSGPPRVNIAP
jgi:hypothetical protein